MAIITPLSAIAASTSESRTDSDRWGGGTIRAAGCVSLTRFMQIWITTLLITLWNLGFPAQKLRFRGLRRKNSYD